MLKWLTGPKDLARRAEKLYGAVVAAARVPAFYARLGVPDTPEGRLELVVLNLFLVLERLNGGGEGTRDLVRRTIETFVTDMDDCMREMGVGDLTVPKKVKRAAALFYDRSGQYRRALEEPGPDALTATVTAAFEPLLAPALAAAALADYIRAAHDRLAVTAVADVAAANFTLPVPV